MTYRRKEVIGDCTLYQGDCLEVMPTLEPVDAVVDERDAVVYNQSYEKPAKGQHRPPSRGDESMASAQAGNSGIIPSRHGLATNDGRPLRRDIGGLSEGVSASEYSGEIEGPTGASERQVQGRIAEHNLSPDDRKNSLQPLRGDGRSGDPSSGRGSYEQHTGQSGSALLALPHEPPQTGMVGLPEGFGVLTDPPYGIGQDGGRRHRKSSRARVQEKKNWDKTRPQAIVFDWLVSAPAGSIIWGGNYFADMLPPRMGWLYWQKLIGGDFSDGELAWTSRNAALKEITHRKTNAEMEHPTQKPVRVMEWCLGFLPDAKTVLDPFMGSGTTGVACAKLGRKFIGIELEETYFDIAVKRIEDAYKQPDFFVPQPEKLKQEKMEV